MDLGKKVASLRKKNNLTQESLAEKIGVTRQQYQNGNLEKQVLILNKLNC